MNCELIYGTECNPFTGECYTALIPGSIPVSAPHDPLRVSRNPAAPGLLDLTWGTSCGNDVSDYTVHEGALGVWTDHTSVACTTGSAVALSSHLPQAGDRYFLIVPISPLAEGSYGTDSGGVQRMPSVNPCRLYQDTLGCF